MADNPLHAVLDHLRRLHSVSNAAQRSDRELLRAFATRNDQDAFAVVVTRHAPLVWGVCRRILGHHQDAEDAFQATFLILARRAGSVRWQSSVGGWLHTVAERLAVRARRQAEQRRLQENEANRTPPDASLRDLAAVVDEELRRLPAKYREPLLLHYLEGATAEAAARQLGLSRGTFYNRLTRGRELLRERLSRQGLSLTAPLLAAALTAEAEAASPSVIQATIRSVTGNVPEHVAALATETLGATGMMKLKIGLALGLLLGLSAGGVALLTPLSSTPSAERPAELPKAEEKAAVRVDRYGDPLPPDAVARLGTLRFRMDSEQAHGLSFTPDGKTIAIASGGLWLFDAATGKRTKSLRPRGWSIWQVALSPDGKRLLAAVQGQKPIPVKNGLKLKSGVQIWDMATGRKTKEMELESILGLGWTAEGQPLVACHDKEAIDLQEITTGRKRRFSAKDLPTPTWPQCAIGKRILAATGNETGFIHVWDMESGKERWTFETGGAFSLFHSLILSADERWLASLTNDSPNKNTLKLWDLTTGKARRLVAADSSHLESTAFTRDGKTLGAIGQKGVRFWDTASGRERGRLKSEGRSFNVAAVSFAPDGKTLATMEGLCGAIHLWDVDTGERKPEPEGHSTNWLPTASFSPDGKRVATSGGLDGTIRIWDSATGRQLLQFHRPFPNNAASCAFSTDGRTLVSCWNDRLLVSDAAAGSELHVLRCANMEMYLSSDLRTAIALQSPPGGIGGGVYSGGMGTKFAQEISGWDIATQKQLFRRMREFRENERRHAISPEGNVFAIPDATQELMHLEDVKTGERLSTFPVPKGELNPLTFSPDGRLLVLEASLPAASAAPGSFTRALRMRELLTGRELLTLPVSMYLSATTAFSRDGRFLAAIAPEGDLFLWDVRRGKELHRFKGFDSLVTSLAFSPDGRRVVSGHFNSTLLVWDVPLPESTPAVKLGAESMTKAWADLAGSDASRAFRARWTLASASEEAVSFLQEHLHPAKAADPQRLRRLLADLDSEQFAIREKAQGELVQLGDLAEPALRQTLANNPSLEMRQRVQATLERLRAPVTQPQLLQALRAVAVLEDIGTSQARRLLEQLTKGAPQSRLTREAKASLERLERRSTSK
jgi:RNA polymerase sigma factor (sigma-70 family)